MKKLTLLLLCISIASSSFAGPLDKTECIAPAKPGGGFDLTCKLLQSGLKETGLIKDPMRISYMPGGVGAVAYNAIIAQRPAEPNTLIAFSSGSLLNIAQGKFGKYTDRDVRWVATVGSDFGAVIVRKDAPYQTLKEMLAALQKDPAKTVFGAGGSVGGQDWMKAALVAKAAGVDHKTMRYVAFEGGGEAIAALQGGHIQVCTGDAAEALGQIEAGAPIRLLAVLSQKRLMGKMAHVPTAKEQGIDVTWPIVRGFYVGPKVSDADYQTWVELFNKLQGTPEFAKLRERNGLFPFSAIGKDVDDFVKHSTDDYRKLIQEFGLGGGAK